MPRGGGAQARRRAPETTASCPSLLKDDAPVNVNADRLSYAGAGGAATYIGNAALWQGSDTSIRADELRLDQSKGDLTASGAARSIARCWGAKPSVGRADEIRYEDAKRVIVYESVKPAPAAGPGGRQGRRPHPLRLRAGAAARAAARSRGAGAAGAPAACRWRRAGADAGLRSGPQGELRAWRIEMALTPDAGKADRLEAFDDVNLRVDQRRANGERLTYFAEDERYVMTGSAAAPVCVVDPDRATTGKTLVFYRFGR